MKLVTTPLPGVLVVEPTAFADDRGWFMESFSEARWESALRELGEPVPRRFVQDNHSCSHAGVLRGLHYQLQPRAQGKLVRVVRGAAWDVAVDLRRDSAHFGRWFGIELNAVNRRQLWVPEGFGHGFVALEDETHFLYKTTDTYDKASERAIRWDDAQLAIDWPVGRLSAALRVSDKDAAAPRLADADVF
jgi:dTDP-4-dehydrorhamnose 3,5-epimerase